MKKIDLEYLDGRIKQVEERLNSQFESHDKKVEQIAQEFSEQLKTLMKQISQAIWVTEMCKECQLCHHDGNKISECKLLREDANDRR